MFLFLLTLPRARLSPLSLENVSTYLCHNRYAKHHTTSQYILPLWAGTSQAVIPSTPTSNPTITVSMVVVNFLLQ